MRTLLNLPWTLGAILAALVSLPHRIRLHRHPFAIIFYVRSLWWKPSGVRAATSGQVLILGPKLEDKDLEHELVHVEQYMREPLIHPFLYLKENRRSGYRQNKYEVEAYSRAGNVYKES